MAKNMKIKKIILSLLENEKLEKMKYITTSKLMFRKHPHPDGLFSEQIFGPKSNVCQCGEKIELDKYEQLSDILSCPKCKIDYVSPSERHKRTALIKLPCMVLNPLVRWSLPQLFTQHRNERNPYYGYIRGLIKYRYYVRLKDKEYDHTPIPDDKIKPVIFEGDNFEIRDYSEFDACIFLHEDGLMFGPEASKMFIEYLVANGLGDLSSRFVEVYEKYKHVFMINYVIVIPPDLRPMAKADGGKIIAGDINQMYQFIINKLIRLQDSKYLNTINSIASRWMRLEFQSDVDKLYNMIIDMFKGKKGLIRGNILGKRIDFSARAVITPDPTVNLDQCRLSYFIVLEVYKYEIARLIASAGDMLYHEAIAEIEEEYKCKTYKYYDITEKYIESSNKIVILNRQPSLHQHGLVAFKILIGADFTIKINPMVCSGFNADFDGDQMACYCLITKDAIDEAREYLLSTKNLYCETTGCLAYVPSQDIILGIYYASMYDINLLPAELRNLPKPITKKVLMQYLEDNATPELLDSVKRTGLLASTIYNTTISLDDLLKSKIDRKRVEEMYKHNVVKDDVDKSFANVAKAEQPMIKEMLDKCSFRDLILSGARGTPDQAKQILVSRGYVSNSKGMVIDEPVKSCYLDGLKSSELFTSAYGVRKGLTDTADNTSESGALYRLLIYTAINAIKSDDPNSDCGSTEYLTVKVSDYELAHSIINRYYHNGTNLIHISKDNYKSLVGKNIKLRSPIFCDGMTFCSKCCPTMNPRFTNIGIIAAQALGEHATQLVLRTFHTSGLVTKAQDGEMKDIVTDLASVKRIFSKPSKYGLKKSDTIIDFIMLLHTIFKRGRLKLLNYEVLASQLMWDNDCDMFWRFSRDDDINAISCNQVISNHSWVTAAAYGYFKRNLLMGINNQIYLNTIFDHVILGGFGV